jgi:hypothetical protein
MTSAPAPTPSPSSRPASLRSLHASVARPTVEMSPDAIESCRAAANTIYVDARDHGPHRDLYKVPADVERRLAAVYGTPRSFALPTNTPLSPRSSRSASPVTDSEDEAALDAMYAKLLFGSSAPAPRESAAPDGAEGEEYHV